MLTLQKGPHTQFLVGIYEGTNRKTPIARVHYTHDMRDENLNSAPVEGVLEMHRVSIKNENRINDQEFDEIAAMIDDNEEPAVGDGLRQAYWNILPIYERALKREMYLGDTKARFELNIPSKDWPGTATLIGNSGAGKTHFLVEMLVRYLRRTAPGSRKTIIWISPEWEIDKTLKKLKDPKYQMHVLGVDISESALKKSGLDAMSYYNGKIGSIIENHGENSIVCWDDFPDGARALYPILREKYNSMIRVARHRNIGVYSLQHTYSGGKNTSQSLQSNKYIVFFPRSQQNRCITFMRDHLMLSTVQAKGLIRRFAKLDRVMIIQMHSPVAIFNSKYLLLL